MNCIELARLKIMHKNLKDLIDQRNKFYHEGDLNKVSQFDVKIKIKKDFIKEYKRKVSHDNINK